MSMFYLPQEALQAIDQKMEHLTENGAVASTEHSGEMNFSGCASGYCMAWD